MSLNPITFLLTALVFFGIVAYTSYLGHKKTINPLDLTVGGRNMGGLFIALSYGASLVSTSAIVGFGGVAGLYGYSLYWGIFGNMLVGTLIAFSVFGPRVRKLGEELGAQSFPELMGKRFGSPLLQRSIAWIIFVFLPAYTSIILIGGANFMAGAVGMEFRTSLLILAVVVLLYVLYGGLIGVIYTDVFLAVVMFLSSFILLAVLVVRLGGVTNIHEILDNITHLIPQELVSQGHQGWTSMPALGSPIWWSVVSTLVLGITIGTLAQPHLQVKFMAVKDKKNLYIGIAGASIFIWMLTGGSVLAGIFSNAYFFVEQGQTAIQAAGGNVDMIIPELIASLMPEWFVYLFLFGLLSAALSSTASLLHLQGVAFGKDLLHPSRVGSSKSQKRGIQTGTILGLVFALLLAFVMPANIIARATVFWFGLCAICWLPSFVGGLFWKGGTKEGALASLFGGLLFTLFWYAFVKASEAIPLGLCMALTGKEVLFGFPFRSMDPLILGIPFSTLLFVAVSLATGNRKKNEESSDNLAA